MLNLGMGFVFSAHDLASAKMAALEKRFASLDDRISGGSERISTAFQNLGVGVGVFAAGAATVAGAFVLANAAGKFEQSIAAVAAVSGATADEMSRLKDAAIDAGIATQFSPTQATLGLRELAQAGYSAQESIKLLRPVLDLAAGSLGELTPQAAAGLAAQSMKAFGLGTDAAAVSVDRMLQAVNLFALNASELPLALGTASRGAQSLNQSLSETLISLGLVKNVIPGVERASTAVAVAMERLADPRTQGRLRTIGVAVTDQQGKFRQFLDVLGDMAPALERMSEAGRAAFLLKAFGREALGGVHAILTQVTGGIRSNTGETLKGAEAIAYLRQQFDQAGGTAATFANKMLDTFAGQKQLLSGSLETLAIVLGEPFAQALKPVVAAVVEMLNQLLRVIRAMPAGVKKGLAIFAVAAGALTTVVGAVITAKASLGLLAIGLNAVGLSLGSIGATVSATFLPAILVIAALGAVVAAFRIAFDNNVGGIADTIAAVSAKLQLGFGALKQLFEQGGFSDAVYEELNRVENTGLKRFLIRLYQIGFRLQRVWQGFTSGFTAAIDSARPVFERFASVLNTLGTELAGLFALAADLGAVLPSSAFHSFGQIAGAAVATLVTWLVSLVTVAARLASDFIGGFRAMAVVMGPAFAIARNAITDLVRAWRSLVGTADLSNDAISGSIGPWRALADVVGRGVGLAISGLTLGLSAFTSSIAAAVWLVVGLKNLVVGFWAVLNDVNDWLTVWLTEKIPAALSALVAVVAGMIQNLVDELASMAARIMAAFDTVRAFVVGLLNSIPDVLLPKGLEALKGLSLSAEVATTDLLRPLTESLATGLRRTANDAQPVMTLDWPSSAFTSSAEGDAHGIGVPRADYPVSFDATATMPAAVETAARAREVSERSLDPRAAVNQSLAASAAPLTVNVQVDGETIARAVHNAQQSNAARAFSPLPAY